MLQENVAVQRRTIKSFLGELATYVSLLTPLLGALIAWRGLGETNYFFLFYAVLPLVVGIIWLVSQYRLAKNKIKKDGVVQRPAWLWKLITNKIPHKSEQLLDSQVMVFVPPTKEAHAVRLAEEYNSDGNHILLFHYIPEPINGVIDEQQGQISHNGEPRSLETLAEEMNECAALILLDDTKWEKYQRTMDLVEEWTKRHTVRPVMSVHLDGRGTLNYSWNRIEDILRPNHSLKNRLLAQSANRGAKWFWQARLYRRVVLWTLSLALIFSLVSFFISYNWHRDASKLEDEVNIFSKIISSDPSAQQETSRAFNNYRSTPETPEPERLRKLLQVHANQLRTTLVSASGQPEAIYGNVIMFSVKKIQDRKWHVQEVAASRIAPYDGVYFPVEWHPENVTSDIKGIVSCAVVSHAFILWSGEWEGKEVKTTDIKAWDLEGKKNGTFDKSNGKYNINNYRCEYIKQKEEDLHRRMLCAPVGVDLNSDKVPAGAICVSYTQDLKFLEEEWVRHTIARYGSTLSFASWEQALPGTDKDGGSVGSKIK